MRVQTGRPTPAVASSNSHNGLFSREVAKGWARRVRKHVADNPHLTPEAVLHGLGMDEPNRVKQVLRAMDGLR